MDHEACQNRIRELESDILEYQTVNDLQQAQIEELEAVVRALRGQLSIKMVEPTYAAEVA